MSKPLVYLAGPITGLSYDGATSWREEAVSALAENGIVGLSPLRAKDYLLNEIKLADEYDAVMSTGRAITTRDRFDCTRADMVLVNLLGASKVSIGTVMELAWADLARVPVVLCIEREENPHEHAMIRETIGWRVDSVEAAIDVVVATLAQG